MERTERILNRFVLARADIWKIIDIVQLENKQSETERRDIYGGNSWRKFRIETFPVV